jgi:hypothetical protein
MELIKYKCDDTLQAATRRAYGHGTIVHRNKHRIFLTTLFIEAYQKPLSFTVRTYAHTHTESFLSSVQRSSSFRISEYEDSKNYYEDSKNCWLWVNCNMDRTHNAKTEHNHAREKFKYSDSKQIFSYKSGHQLRFLVFGPRKPNYILPQGFYRNPQIIP